MERFYGIVQRNKNGIKMIHTEIRKKFLEFFEKRGHKIVPSSSLIPDDASVLFTTAGMQQFKKYYLDGSSPYGNRVASIQKSIRTTDIDEVGDESHLTFFEMLGNFSFKFPEGEGAYFKEEAIKFGYDFMVGELGIPLERIKIFVFKGDKENNVPTDQESLEIWKKLGIPEDKIFFGERKDNFWGPTGLEGPCGPTTEIYVDGVEVWNIVFNEYYCDKEKELVPLERKGVDTGMGLERLAMVIQGKKNVFETDLFSPIFEKLSEKLPERIKRIIADHSRAVVFLVSDGVRPSNKEQGYVLRRLMRRIIVYAYQENIESPPQKILETVVELYKTVNDYKNLNFSVIEDVYDEEYAKFIKSVGSGLKELEKLESIDAQSAFRLYESYGLPYEIIKETAGTKAEGLTHQAFDEEFKKHQEISRAGAGKKFGK